MRFLWPRAILGLIACACASTGRPKLESPPVADWQRFDAERYFSFFGPRDLREVREQPIDSFVGHYVNDDMDLSFDYGSYSDSLEFEIRDHRSEERNVHGEHARFVWYQGSMAVFFPATERHNNLTMSVTFSRAPRPELGEKIFESVRFWGNW